MASIENGYFVPRQGAGMSAFADVAEARELVSHLEAAESKRQGRRINEVRPDVARRIKAQPGTLENLRRQRLKTISSDLMGRIRAEFIAVLRAEVLRLESEIALHVHRGAIDPSRRLAAARACLQQAKEILNGTGSS